MCGLPSSNISPEFCKDVTHKGVKCSSHCKMPIKSTIKKKKKKKPAI